MKIHLSQESTQAFIYITESDKVEVDFEVPLGSVIKLSLISYHDKFGGVVQVQELTTED